MTTGLASVASLVGGAVLALLAIFGTVSAVTPSANPASASDGLVSYDAR